MPKPYTLLTVGTSLLIIGFAIPGSFPGTLFCLIGGYLVGSGLVGLILP
jgi:hypothetical protein